MEIIEKLDELYGMINSIIIEKTIEEKIAGNLYFTSRNNQLLDKEKTFKKLNESLDFLEEIKFEIQYELSKLHQPTVISSVYCRQCGKKFKDGLSENLHNM